MHIPEFGVWLSSFIGQFRGLDRGDPSSWPLIPRSAVFLCAYCVTLAALWFYPLSEFSAELDKLTEQQLTLQTDFQDKFGKSANLQLLKQQRDAVAVTVEVLEKQLPNRAEMSGLLLSVSQMGIGRNLQTELFQPDPVVFKPYYAVIPVTYKATGRFHDFAKFASDVAELPRIVNLSNISISPKTDGILSFEVTVKTYRYLDPAEVAAQANNSKASK
jgi:type IV pilus assembly protein PilO